jgi:hypothetical protein
MSFHRRRAAVLDRCRKTLTPRTLGDLTTAAAQWITILDGEDRHAGHLLHLGHSPGRTYVVLRWFTGEEAHDVCRDFPSDTPIEVAG